MTLEIEPRTLGFSNEDKGFEIARPLLYEVMRNEIVRQPKATELNALLERGIFLPQALDRGAALLGLQALLARAGGRLGRAARNRRHRGALDQVHETFARVLAVARLGAMAVGVDHEHALAREPAAGEAFEPRAYVVGKARRAAHVEAKLDRARKLVDVLPARARGANEMLLELALGDADRRGDADHR